MVPAPAHGLPIEYMEGPYRYRGTMRGEPVSGFAFYERSLALYRDWELIDVLASAVENLSGADPELADAVDQLRPLIAVGKSAAGAKVVAVHARSSTCGQRALPRCHQRDDPGAVGRRLTTAVPVTRRAVPRRTRPGC